MKFDLLFNQVFLTEDAEEYIHGHDENNPNAGAPAVHDDTSVEPTGETPDGVPTPDNYSVDPAPVGSSGGDAGTLKEQVRKLDEFAEALNGVDGESLQKLVNDMDRPGSLFQGISRETSPEIIRIAGQVAELSEIIKGFVINSAKRSRDIAAGAAGNQR
jgi:hypothetical protein